MPLNSKQAGIELTLGRETGTCAGAAERLRHRSDHADLAGPVRVAPAFGYLTGVVWVGGLEGHLRRNGADDLGSRHHIVHAPAVGVTYVHVFDEAQDVTLLAEEARHRQDAG